MTDEEIDDEIDYNPSDLREIGDEAIWSLSTAKPGNGVEQIRDDNVDTYWQSDGIQPHLINIQFLKKMSILVVALYLDHDADESYTPKKVCIKVGTTANDLMDVKLVEFDKPQGWVQIPLKFPCDHQTRRMMKGGKSGGLLRGHFLQISILAMDQNGRDTHIRQVKVYGPRNSLKNPMIRSIGGSEGTTAVPEFTTVEFSQFSTIR